MCQETSKEVVHPRNLTNNFPNMAIFEAGVTFSKAHHFGAIHVSFWRCIVWVNPPILDSQCKWWRLVTWPQWGVDPKYGTLELCGDVFVTFIGRALGQWKQKKCLGESKLLLFWGQQVTFIPYQNQQDLPKRIGVKNSFPGNVNPEFFLLSITIYYIAV